MATLSALRAEVLLHVANCPFPLVDNAILKSLIEFCNRSRAYRYAPDAIAIVAGNADYDPDLPAATEIAWLLAAELDGNALGIRAPADVPASWSAEQGAVTTAIVINAKEISLRKVPDAPASLTVRLALRPSLAATTYPDDLHGLYQDCIVAGALARLYAQPGRPWSSADLVNDCRHRFEIGISDAEYRADRGSANAQSRTALHLIGGR